MRFKRQAFLGQADDGGAVQHGLGSGATLQSEHRLIEGILQQIEAIADLLPSLPPAEPLEVIVSNLRHALPAHCRHEEDVLLRSDAPEFARALEIIRAEHVDNDWIAAELAEALEDCMATGRAACPEAPGRLARQYFVLMRRHMAWEELVGAWISGAAPQEDQS